MREVRPGVWHWQAPHPDWSKDEWWPEHVSSYGIQVGDEFLLFDPLSVPDELRDRATAVVLTAPYHERDARRLGLPVHTPPADTWEDWVEKFGVDPEGVRGMESDDLAWLRAGEGEGHFHGPAPDDSVRCSTCRSSCCCPPTASRRIASATTVASVASTSWCKGSAYVGGKSCPMASGRSS